MLRSRHLFDVMLLLSAIFDSYERHFFHADYAELHAISMLMLMLPLYRFTRVPAMSPC